jgi:hypothetical protein
MEELTVTVNNRTYELSDSFRSDIERIAENEYSDNHLLDYYWRVAGSDEDDHAYGEPLLCIETEGHQVPWDNISEFSMQGSDTPKDMSLGLNALEDRERRDNGDGTVSVPPNPGEHTPKDRSMIMFPASFGPSLPDATDDDISTLHPMPESVDDLDGPEMLIQVPEDTRPERWAAGEAIVPAFTAVEWNLQRRADTVYAPMHPSNKNSHDKWEQWMKRLDCTLVDTSSDDDMDKEQRKRMYSDDADLGPKFGPSASNFRV